MDINSLTNLNLSSPIIKALLVVLGLLALF